MTRSSEILNNVHTVNVLVSALKLPNALSDMCIIGHNLLLSDRLALHKCRYVCMSVKSNLGYFLIFCFSLK